MWHAPTMVRATVAGQEELEFLGDRERLAVDDLRAAVARGQVLVTSEF